MRDRFTRANKVRHAERERIARDLHDTLLPAVQALLFRLQLWEDDAAVPRALRAELAVLVRQAQAIVVEGRDRITMLRRADAGSVDLTQALAAIESQGFAAEGVCFEVSSDGERRSLTRVAHEQLVDIAREAVRNAYRHACPSSVVVMVEYRKASLRMSVIDDGCGIDAVTREERGKGHFGLLGMRERAEQLGGSLWIGGNAGAGTRVTVVVPARTAYQDSLSPQRPHTDRPAASCVGELCAESRPQPAVRRNREFGYATPPVSEPGQ